jgi:molybdenum cofactor cytidylyltransferase
MIAAIILAAGDSIRMGFPKALLPYRGSTFLATVLDACRAAGVDRRMVVLGRDAANILAEVDLAGVELVRNPDPETGPLRSIQLALEEIVNHPVEGALVWHVDRPHIPLAVVEVLLDRFRQGGAAIVVPEFEGQRGHPVVFGRAVFRELLDTPIDRGARAVVRADPSRVAAVKVAHAAVIEDVDTPEAYRDLLRRSDLLGTTPRLPEPPAR